MEVHEFLILVESVISILRRYLIWVFMGFVKDFNFKYYLQLLFLQVLVVLLWVLEHSLKMDLSDQVDSFLLRMSIAGT